MRHEPGYAVAYEHANDAVLLTAPDGRILAANPAACRLLRLSEDEICAAGRQGLRDPDDPRWEGAVATRAREGSVRCEVRMRRGDGTTVEVDLSSATFQVGDTTHAVVHFRDMSETSRRLADESRARRAATEVVATLDAITDGFFSLDEAWIITYFNRQAEKMTGVRREQVVGRHLMDAFPGVRGNAFEHHYTAAMANGQTAVFRDHYGPLGLDLEVRAHPLPDGGLAVYFLDITERMAAEREREQLLRSERAARASAEASRRTLAHRATHDPVTDLLNRAGLDEAGAALAAHDAERPVAALFIDLDNFKLVNDTWGHTMGDEALKAVALRLLGVVGPDDVVARFGGDEFVVLVPEADTAGVELRAEEILRISRSPLEVLGRMLNLTASVGMAMARTSADLEALLREADTALSHAKESGRARWAWFDDDLRRRVLDRVVIETDLRAAIAAGGEGFDLAYQPAYTLASGRPEHVEALARWEHPRRGQIVPAEFIPVAEATGLIVELGALLLDRAVQRATRWHPDGVRTWVNVSQRQLVTPGLCRTIQETLLRHGCPASALGIEITESVLADPAVARDELLAVARLGVAIAIDDFGVGYSSMAALAGMPLDVLKIDRSFVAQIGTTTGDAVIAAILNLGRAFDLHVVAEGVETEAQLARLQDHGCDSASGYYLEAPRPAPEHWAHPHPAIAGVRTGACEDS